MRRGLRWWWVLGAMGLGMSTPSRAHALQPLEAFVAASKSNNPDNREARAVREQRDAQRDAAMAAYLPSFTAQGIYTRNQYEAAFTGPSGQKAVLTPLNGLDANLTLAVPIINVGAWEQRRAATANLAVADATRASTELSIESSVTQAYYQVLGNEAVLASAKEGVEFAASNIKLVQDRRELGTASELDVQRAVADLARAQRDVAQADQGVVQARRALESLSRLTPEPATREDYREDDLRDEAPLPTWLRRSKEDLVSVRPSVLAIEAAERSRSATRAAWLPTLSAQAQERFTNAGGFTGRHTFYTVQAVVTWRFDFGLAPNVAAQTAAVDVARAREDKARRAAEDTIYQAWHQVRVGLEKSRAARAQVKSATVAQELARDRYASGVATQLEVVQAQRDFFSAAVSQAQADFDLKYARAALRLSSRRVSDGEGSR